MIVCLIDTTSDAHLLHKVYEGIEDALVYVNPTEEEIDAVLKERPNEMLVGLGHGCASGLFGGKHGIIIGSRNIELLKDRELVCIWCNADGFGRRYPQLNGFFTSMFISNEGEANCYGYRSYSNEDIFGEVTLFSERVNKLLKDKTPLNEWVEILYNQHDDTKGYVQYNYRGLRYFFKEENNVRKVIEYDFTDNKVMLNEEKSIKRNDYDYIDLFFETYGMDDNDTFDGDDDFKRKWED